jgi:hypothetical protein
MWKNRTPKYVNIRGGRLTKTKFIGRAARGHEGFFWRLKYEKFTVKKVDIENDLHTVKKTPTFPNNIKTHNKGYEF